MGVFPATVQTASDIAGRLVDMELYGLPEDYFDRYRENIGALARDDITRVAKKYIDPERAIFGNFSTLISFQGSAPDATSLREEMHPSKLVVRICPIGRRRFLPGFAQGPGGRVDSDAHGS